MEDDRVRKPTQQLREHRAKTVTSRFSVCSRLQVQVLTLEEGRVGCQWLAIEFGSGSVASCGNRLMEGGIGKQTEKSARLPSAEPGRSKSYQRAVETTRYPYERTWSVATYLSPIAVRSRRSCIAAPLDAQDMPNRASTDGVVPKSSIGGMTRSAISRSLGLRPVTAVVVRTLRHPARFAAVAGVAIRWPDRRPSLRASRHRCRARVPRAETAAADC